MFKVILTACENDIETKSMCKSDFVVDGLTILSKVSHHEPTFPYALIYLKINEVIMRGSVDYSWIIL